MFAQKWYALYTKPKWEKKVAENLLKQGIEHYCPVNKVQKQWSDRKKIIYEPLFFSYVFVCITPGEFNSVKQTSGVLNIVYWLNKPAIIRDSEIEIIKRFLNDHDQVKLEKTEVRVDQYVSISSGLFMNYEGQIKEIKNNIVSVFLPSLGYKMMAEVQIQNVEFIKYTRRDKIL